MSTGVASQSSCFGSNALEDVVDERVHDTHGSLGDSSFGMHLSQNLVDVRRVGLSSLALPNLLGLVSSLLGSLGRGLGGFGRRGFTSFWSHFQYDSDYRDKSLELYRE